MQSNDGHNSPRIDLKAIDLLDKANEFAWTLKILSFMLFLDSVLCFATGFNLWTYPWAQFQWLTMLGKIIVVVLSYAIIASAVVPLADACVGWVTVQIYYSLPYFLFAKKEQREPPRHYVRPYQLLEHADTNQDDYALARYKEHESTVDRAISERFQLGRAAFRTLFFLILNLVVSSPEHPSTIFEARTFVSAEAYVVCYLGAGLLLFYLCCLSWFRYSKASGWVEYAPLYRELEKKREEERERHRKLTRGMYSGRKFSDDELC